MQKIKKIGIFTSGGDCSGLNAVIDSVVKVAHNNNIEVYGIYEGPKGLLYPNLNYKKLEPKDLQNNLSFMRMGGTILKSKNGDGGVTNTAEKNRTAFMRGVKELNLDSIIVVGGDGSAMIVSELIDGTDINVICIPKTIDNDTPATEYSVGFDTARNVTMDAMDKLQTTAFSHNRIMILEVMGRDAGHLALHTAIAGDAFACLIPEIKYNLNSIYDRIEGLRKEGRYSGLIVVAEGCKTEHGENLTVDRCGTACYTGMANYLSKKLEEKGYLNRITVLGHVQRGGAPTAYDRIIAAEFGTKAIEILLAGKNKRIVVLKNGKVDDVDLFEAVKIGNRPVDPNDYLVKTARALGIYVGDE